jgi:antitoxin MazE
MQSRIQKWGNSLALRIPNAFARQSRVKTGSLVDLSLRGGRLIVTPVAAEPTSLKKLLRGVNAKNIHKNLEFGAPQGKEVW